MTLRKRPEDFRVIERLTPDAIKAIRPLDDRGRYLVVEVTKTSLTTAEAVARAAKAFAVPIPAISPAGQKDKHALTTQHVSIDWPADRAAPKPMELAAVTVRPLGWLDTPLQAAAIDRNHFELVVRDLDRRACLQMDAHGELLAEGPECLLIINYFGDQRFGSARHGQGFAARALIDGDFEAALKLLIATPARKDTGARRALTRAAATHWGDWPAILKVTQTHPDRRAIESLARHPDFRAAFLDLPHATQQWCIESYQSWLWNDVARRMVQSLRADRDQIFIAEDDHGDLPFPAARVMPKHWPDTQLPMPAAEALVPSIARDAYATALAAEGLTSETLTIPGVRRPRFEPADRPLAVRAESVRFSPPETDELANPRSPARWKRTLAFDLPRGAYATIVLRALGQ